MVDLSVVVCVFDYSIFGLDEIWKLGLIWCVNDELMLCVVCLIVFCVFIVFEFY